MKKILLTITFFSFLAILPVSISAQTNCIIEPGIGCGKIHLGITKSEIKSILGEGKQDSFTNSLEYENLGLVIQFESTNNTVNKVLFVVNPKVWGSEKFNAFSGSLPMNLSFETNPNHLTQIFGKPQEQAVFGDTTSIKYQGLEFGFRGNNLMFVEVNKVEPISAKNQVTIVSQSQNIETPIPTPPPIPVVAKSGTFDDCKIILSEGCRNFFLQSTVDELRSKVKLYRRNSDGEFQLSGEGFTLTFEPSSGGIISVSFYNLYGKKQFDRKPAQNLKWKESVKSVRKKYGEPLSVYDHYETYSDFMISVWDDELTEISLRRERTAAESSAENARYWNKRHNENTPEVAAASLMERLNVNINYINYLTERHNKIKAGNANNRAAQIIDDTWGEIPKLLKQIEGTKLQSIDLIDKFLKDYGNKIDDATKSKLLEHRQNFGGNSLKPLPR